MRISFVNPSLIKQATKQILAVVFVAVSVSACAKIIGQEYGGGAAPNQAVNDAQCKKFANAYIRTHGIDKDWRQQEFYTQYRICMNRTAQKS